MTIDAHFIITALLGIVCAVLGWLGRELWTAVQTLRADLSALEIKIGADYIRYDRLQDALLPIKEALNEIKNTLAHKQDKP